MRQRGRETEREKERERGGKKTAHNNIYHRMYMCVNANTHTTHACTSTHTRTLSTKKHMKWIRSTPTEAEGVVTHEPCEIWWYLHGWCRVRDSLRCRVRDSLRNGWSRVGDSLINRVRDLLLRRLGVFLVNFMWKMADLEWVTRWFVEFVTRWFVEFVTCCYVEFVCFWLICMCLHTNGSLGCVVTYEPCEIGWYLQGWWIFTWLM